VFWTTTARLGPGDIAPRMQMADIDSQSDKGMGMSQQ
jgi:hypothetical protein